MDCSPGTLLEKIIKINGLLQEIFWNFVMENDETIWTGARNIEWQIYDNIGYDPVDPGGN